jgi:hypothetical protein
VGRNVSRFGRYASKHRRMLAKIYIQRSFQPSFHFVCTYMDFTLLIDTPEHCQPCLTGPCLICVQQSCGGVIPPHRLVHSLQPEAHDECANDDSGDETCVCRHRREISWSVRFWIEVWGKDERRHGDTIHDRQSAGFLLGGLTTCGSNPSNDNGVSPCMSARFANQRRGNWTYE